jgi:hypothetical protein
MELEAEGRRELPQTETPEAEKPRESKVHKLSQEAGLYTPKERERQTPGLLTAAQYVRKAKLDEAVAGLIRSLRKTSIMPFEEWERETAALLKKKTW